MTLTVVGQSSGTAGGSGPHAFYRPVPAVGGVAAYQELLHPDQGSAEPRAGARANALQSQGQCRSAGVTVTAPAGPTWSLDSRQFGAQLR